MNGSTVVFTSCTDFSKAMDERARTGGHSDTGSWTGDTDPPPTSGYSIVRTSSGALQRVGLLFEGGSIGCGYGSHATKH